MCFRKNFDLEVETRSLPQLRPLYSPDGATKQRRTSFRRHAASYLCSISMPRFLVSSWSVSHMLRTGKQDHLKQWLGRFVRLTSPGIEVSDYVIRTTVCQIKERTTKAPWLLGSLVIWSPCITGNVNCTFFYRLTFRRSRFFLAVVVVVVVSKKKTNPIVLEVGYATCNV